MKEDEFDLANVSSWIGPNNPVRKALVGIDPLTVPDTSFRNWPDELGRYRTEARMTDSQLAYSLGFLRTDLHVLVFLSVAHAGLKLPYEIAAFLNSQDLLNSQSIDRKKVSEILRQLSQSAYGDIQKTGDHIFSGYCHNTSMEGFLMQAGHMFDFSKKHPEPLSSFIGKTKGRTDLADTDAIEESFRLAANRLQIARAIKELWRETDYAPGFSATRSQIQAKTGLTSSNVDTYLLHLSQGCILEYQTQGPNEGAYQRYRIKPGIKKIRPKDVQTHQSFSDYVREYILIYLKNLTVSGAVDFLMHRLPEFADLDEEKQKKLYKRVESSMKHLQSSLICSETHFAHGAQSYIAFTKDRKGTSFADYVNLLDTLQSESQENVNTGITLGKEIVVDRKGITGILQKIKKFR